MESKDNFEFPIDNSIPVTEWINFTTWTGKKIAPLHTMNKGGRTYETNLACCELHIYRKLKRASLSCWRSLFGFILSASLRHLRNPLYNVCDEWSLYFKEETMHLEISNPMDYHVALYIRLSKEDETEGPSQSVTKPEIPAPMNLFSSIAFPFTIPMSLMVGAVPVLTALTFSA